MLGGLDERALFPPDDVDAAAERLRALAADAAGAPRSAAHEHARQVDAVLPARTGRRHRSRVPRAIAARRGRAMTDLVVLRSSAGMTCGDAISTSRRPAAADPDLRVLFVEPAADPCTT